MNRQDLKVRMIANAKAYNKYLADEYLNSLSENTLLNFTGPLERDDFSNELRKIELNEL